MAYSSDNGYILDSRPIFRGGVKKHAISNDLALSPTSESFQIIDNQKGASAIVSLAPEDDGLYQWIKCHPDSGHQLEIRNDAGGTIVYLTVGQSGLFVCAGSEWHLAIKA